MDKLRIPPDVQGLIPLLSKVSRFTTLPRRDDRNGTLLEKARNNRKGAVDYVASHKARLFQLTGANRDDRPRMPFASIGFSSIRPSLPYTGSAA